MESIIFQNILDDLNAGIVLGIMVSILLVALKSRRRY